MLVGEWLRRGSLVVPRHSLLFNPSQSQPSSFLATATGSGSCISTSIVSAIAASFLALLAPLFVALSVDTNPLSVNFAAKVHGRADVCMLACQFVLVAIVNVWPASLSPWALAAAVLVAGIVWESVSLLMMPYYKHSM